MELGEVCFFVTTQTESRTVCTLAQRANFISTISEAANLNLIQS